LRKQVLRRRRLLLLLRTRSVVELARALQHAWLGHAIVLRKTNFDHTVRSIAHHELDLIAIDHEVSRGLRDTINLGLLVAGARFGVAVEDTAVLGEGIS